MHRPHPLLRCLSESIHPLVALGLLFQVWNPAWGEEPPELVTDRPDQTESTSIVPPGYLQLEVGWTHTEDDEHGEDFEGDSLPETLIRYGLCEKLELRLGHSGHSWEEVEFDNGAPSEEVEGWGDAEIGFKYDLWDEIPECWIPDAALLMHLSLPTGAEGHSSERADPSVRFNFTHTLAEDLSISYNLGAEWETLEDARGEEDTLSTFIWTVSVGKSLTDRLGAFVEIYGDAPLSAEGGATSSLDGGFTYLLTDNLQIDILAGAGLSERADDWFIGSGVSYRFPR